ncbi:MAG: flagellar export chaperone FliS [Bacillota bacterium]|nr:flagellar export chaperone FliS [Bacillota bacterium]
MVVVNPYDQYRQAQVLTAPPERLVLMLYDGAIRFLDEARAALNARDTARVHERVTRVQDILTELMATLDFSYEISGNLYRLYEYLHGRLVQANLKKEAAPLDEVQRLLRELCDTWTQALISQAGGGENR